MLGPLALVALFRPRLNLRARLRELGQTLLAQGQLVGNRQAVGDVGLVLRLGARQQVRHLGLQLRLELARVLPRQRAVTAGVGVYLRAVEADRAHLQHAHLARKQQHTDEQPLDLLEKPPPERGDRVVVGVVVGGDVAERHAVVSRPLQFAAGKHPRRIAVNQDAQEHPGRVRRRAGAAISADHAAKIEPVDHLHDKPRQMSLRQPLLHRRRQKKHRLAINVSEIAHRQQAILWPRINRCDSSEKSAVGLSPTGC